MDLSALQDALTQRVPPEDGPFEQIGRTKKGISASTVATGSPVQTIRHGIVWHFDELA